MKAYKCDSCGRFTEDPHAERMKEFRVSMPVIPDDNRCNYKKRMRIHLCNECFKGLRYVAEKNNE